MKSLTEHNHVPKHVTKRKLQIIKENKDIITAKSISKVVNYKSKLLEYKAMPKKIDATVIVPSLKVKASRGKELCIEFGDHSATLTQTLRGSLPKDAHVSSSTSLLRKNRHYAEIQLSTRCKYLDAVACVGSDEAWVCCGSESIIRLDIRGSVRESVSIKNKPADISVTQQGQMIYTEFDGKYVKIVRLGVTEPLIKAPEDWKPWGLCCTNSGDILVDLVREDSTYDHKIVRYTGMKAIQEIENDSNGERIFQSGTYIIYLCENRNADVCTSDGNGKAVIVLDAKGKVKFQYEGYEAIRKKYFCPEQIATDSMSQIIVTDHNNDCLHILDRNGQFLQCVDDSGLDTPGGLSVDSKGRCWVGLHSGKLKVISLNM